MALFTRLARAISGNSLPQFWESMSLNFAATLGTSALLRSVSPIFIRNRDGTQFS